MLRNERFARPDLTEPAVCWILTVLTLAGFFALFYEAAWIADDAFITFRSVRNFVSGCGLRWNLGERVQAFTHPLWFFLLSVTYRATGDFYLAAIALSALTCAATLLLTILTLTRAGCAGLSPIFIVLLAGSAAFVDYTSSGLENPLAYLITAAFFLPLVIDGTAKVGTAQVLRLTSLTAMLFLTRADLVLLALPSCLHALLPSIKGKHAGQAAAAASLGIAPAVLWCIFAWWYFGSPFPNTAYAKLGTGISRYAAIQQGAFYFLDSWRNDRFTLTVIQQQPQRLR